MSLEFDSTANVAPVPGTYPALPSQVADGGITILLSIGSSLCAATRGSVTVLDDVQNDAGTGALLATFDIFCGVSGMPDDEMSGCVRFQAEAGAADASVVPPETGYDAGIFDTLDAGANGDYLAPCLGHPLALYVEGTALSASPVMVTEAEGNWFADQSAGDATLVVQMANAWQLQLSPPSGNALTPGTTYRDAGSLPSLSARFALEANGVTCDSPNASFTVWDYADTGGDQGSVTRLTASFDVTCSNGSGDVRGCVRFTE